MKHFMQKILWILITSQWMQACTPFGADIQEEALLRHASSKQFNKENLAFENRRPHLYEQMNKRFLTTDGFKSWWNKSEDTVPLEDLPTLIPDLQEFLQNPSQFKGIWFGHSTFLLQLDGKTILLDPIFSAGAAPVSFIVPRFQAPVLDVSQLPNIDFIVISHDHYDHLDYESILKLKAHLTSNKNC